MLHISFLRDALTSASHLNTYLGWKTKHCQLTCLSWIIVVLNFIAMCTEMHSCRLGLIIHLKQKNNLDKTVSCYFPCWLWSWLSQGHNVPSWFIARKNVIMSFPVSSRQSLEQWQEIPLWSLVLCCSIVQFFPVDTGEDLF